jgi:hypothetical protein
MKDLFYLKIDYLDGYILLWSNLPKLRPKLFTSICEIHEYGHQISTSDSAQSPFSAVKFIKFVY